MRIDLCVMCRYGPDAGKFADHIVNAATSTAAASYNFSHLGLKAIAKRAAVDTTAAVVTSGGTAPASGTSSESSAGGVSTSQNLSSSHSDAKTCGDITSTTTIVDKLQLAEELAPPSVATPTVAPPTMATPTENTVASNIQISNEMSPATEAEDTKLPMPTPDISK